MMKTKRWIRGQSTAEYAIVIALVLGALIGMQTYVRRAMNGRIADASDTRFPQDANFGRRQFEPYYANSNTGTTSHVDTGANGIRVRGAAGTASAVTGTFTSTTVRTGGSSESGRTDWSNF